MYADPNMDAVLTELQMQKPATLIIRVRKRSQHTVSTGPKREGKEGEGSMDMYTAATNLVNELDTRYISTAIVATKNIEQYASYM